VTAAILVLAIGLAIFWLVFFRLKLLRLTPAWGTRRLGGAAQDFDPSPLVAELALPD